MKRNVFIGLLVAEAFLCVAFCIFKTSRTGIFTALMAFPFEQIGLGLRLLSLSGGVGNAAAILVYLIACLSPLAVLFMIRKNYELHIEDMLLGMLSIILFVVLYLMINPGYINTMIIGLTGQSINKALLGAVVYSILCGYSVLRILRLLLAAGMDKLNRYMTTMLCLLNVLFIYLAFGVVFDSLLNSFKILQDSNIGNTHLLRASYIGLAAQFIVNALPYILDVFVVFAALRLLREMRIDRYSIEAVEATNRMVRLCTMALAATVFTNIAFNVSQLLFLKSLLVVNASVQIPVLSIIFVLAALLLTQLLSENKQLKEDNDMFV